jgi:hypothetical protein
VGVGTWRHLTKKELEKINGLVEHSKKTFDG